MKQASKLTTNQQQEQAAELQSGQKAFQQFDSVEEMLRHDAKQTEVPPTVAERLSQSLKETEAPRRPWWKRWLG